LGLSYLRDGHCSMPQARCATCTDTGTRFRCLRRPTPKTQLPTPYAECSVSA
jgi:hypothetical protein